MLLHVLPQDFTLDGRAGFRKPHKGVCSRLEANVHIVTASMQEHQALIAAAHLAHLPVEETVFEPMAAAYACLRPEERARGVALLDMGMHSTDLVIYDGEAMLLASSIPVWRDHFTRDIASIFKVTYEDAEMPEAAIRLRAAGPDRRFEPDRSAVARRPPAARSPPQRADRNSGSARRGVVPVRARAKCSASAWSAISRRHRAHRRRRAAERHVRHGGDAC